MKHNMYRIAISLKPCPISMVFAKLTDFGCFPVEAILSNIPICVTSSIVTAMNIYVTMQIFRKFTDILSFQYLRYVLLILVANISIQDQLIKNKTR